MATRWRERIGGACWLACLQFFAAEELSRLGWVGRYSLRWNFISDLGAVRCSLACSHWHALMNGSFFVQGLLIAAGALVLPKRVSGGWLGVAARVILLLAAAGLVWIALLPEDVNMNGHIAGAFLYFGASSLAMLAWGVSQWVSRSAVWGKAWVTLTLAALAVCGDVLLMVGGGSLRGVLGPGLIERTAAYPFTLWLAWTGLAVLRARRRAV